MWGSRCIVGLRLLKSLNASLRLLSTRPGPGPGPGPGSGLRFRNPSLRLLSPALPAGSCFLSTGPGSGPGPGPGPGPGLRFRTRLAVALALGGAALASWGLVHREKQQRLRRERVEQLKKGILGKGNFSLLDQRGLRRTKEDFLGSWVLVYFGFTHCPDICPEELDKLTNVVLDLDRDPDLPRVQPVFITVDPDRDHVEAVARYLQDFHPRMVGLTGTPQEVREAGRDYRVYASPGPKDEDGDYIVDHTVLIYLVSPDGLFLDYYNRTKDQDQITKSVRNHIKTYVPLEDQD